MKFLADENVALPIANWIRAQGYDVLHAGESDSIRLQQAQAEARLILPADKDLWELVFRDHLNSHGVELMRMEHLVIPARLARVQAVWSVVEANPKGKFIVITERKVRVRDL